MGSSRFVRHFEHRALRHLPGPPRPSGLETRLDLRPARFVVGLGEPVQWAGLAGQGGAPVCPAFYLGRVEEVVEDEVLVTVWERPSGREATTALSVEEHLGGRRPPVGSLLRLWTWLELPGEGKQVERLRVEVQPPRLDESERQWLRGVVAELKREASEHGEHDA